MQIAMVAAGFSPVEASKLRRSMATFKRTGEIRHFREGFIEGMASAAIRKSSSRIASSRSKASANTVFPKVTPRALRCSSTPRPGSSAITPTCSRRRCSTASRWASTRPRSSCAMRRSTASRCVRSISTAPTGIARWRTVPAAEGHLHPVTPRCDEISGRPTRCVSAFARSMASPRSGARSSKACAAAGFDSIRDLWLRTGLPPKALKKLAQADAFSSLGLSRRDALWAVKALQRAGDKDDLPLFARARCRSWSPTRTCRRCCRASR